MQTASGANFVILRWFEIRLGVMQMVSGANRGAGALELRCTKSRMPGKRSPSLEASVSRNSSQKVGREGSQHSHNEILH